MGQNVLTKMRNMTRTTTGKILMSRRRIGNHRALAKKSTIIKDENEYEYDYVYFKILFLYIIFIQNVCVA